MNFFEQFPLIKYGDKLTRNIITKVVIDDLVEDGVTTFLPYTIQEGDRPWTIAHDYYDDASRVWLVYMSNNIIDPYYEWYLNAYELEEYMKKEYGSLAAAQANIVKYKEVVDGVETGCFYSIDSYTYSTDPNKVNWQPVTSYDIEIDKNDERREIRLLNKIYASQAEKALKNLLKNG